MTITVSLLSIIILLFIINNIIEHLFNWGFRLVSNDRSGGGILTMIFFYIIKTLILILILNSYLS